MQIVLKKFSREKKHTGLQICKLTMKFPIKKNKIKSKFKNLGLKKINKKLIHIIVTNSSLF